MYTIYTYRWQGHKERTERHGSASCDFWDAVDRRYTSTWSGAYRGSQSLPYDKTISMRQEYHTIISYISPPLVLLLNSLLIESMKHLSTPTYSMCETVIGEGFGVHALGTCHTTARYITFKLMRSGNTTSESKSRVVPSRRE